MAQVTSLQTCSRVSSFLASGYWTVKAVIRAMPAIAAHTYTQQTPPSFAASRHEARLDGIAKVDEHVGQAVDAADDVHARRCHLHTARCHAEGY